MKAVFVGTYNSCKMCHSSTPAPTGIQLSGLDLESSGVTARLRDMPAKHLDISPRVGTTPMCPTNDKLIDSAVPESSWLAKKLLNQQGTCGDPMPTPPGGLKTEDVQCLQTYIACVAAP